MKAENIRLPPPYYRSPFEGLKNDIKEAEGLIHGPDLSNETRDKLRQRVSEMREKRARLVREETIKVEEVWDAYRGIWGMDKNSDPQFF